VLIVYGIQSCDMCRKARKYLTAHNIEFEFHDFREDGVDIQRLELWTERIGCERLLNKQSLTWRKIPEVDRNNMTRDRALAAMIDQPTLIKRPVLVADNFIAVGFSEKRFDEFLDKIG
jgi:arsenate reductase